jgi:hypothetical protein
MFSWFASAPSPIAEIEDPAVVGELADTFTVPVTPAASGGSGQIRRTHKPILHYT